jgi:DHA2 family multidrug resistance protein
LKAIVIREFGPPSVMKLEEVPKPEPGPGEVLIKVHAVSVNRTLDAVVRAGKYARRVTLPLTPGVDPSGVIAKVGPGVTARKVGDRVTVQLRFGNESGADSISSLGNHAWGGYAEYVRAVASRTAIVPDGLDFATATVVSRHTPTAFTLLRDRAKLQPGEWVLVMGAAGGLGSAGVQVAKYLGAKVIAAAGAADRVNVGLDLGADAGVNYRAQDLTIEAMRITDGKGVNVVFENIGDPELFPKAFASLARRGRLVTAGGHGGGIVPLDVNRLYQNHLTIIGATGETPDDVMLSLNAAVEGRFKVVVDRIMPLSQAVLLEAFAPQDRGKAMGFWGLGIVVAPILGPVLGGWLTDSYSWRWVFLVNLPVGVICTLMLLRFLPKTDQHARKFDLFGFALLAIAIASLQLFLDRGAQKDWLQSWEIIIELSLAIGGFWMFVVHIVTANEPLFERGMFADANFATGLLFMAVTGVLLLAGLALLPPLLQNLYGYSVLQSGYLTAPRGVGTLISMLLAGRLVGKFDARLLVGLGVVLMGVSLWMMTGFALDQPSTPVIASGVVQGLGLGMIFVPLQSLAFETLKPRLRTTAASLLNLARNVGGSVGISVVSSQLIRMTQVAHADLASHITDQTLPMVDPTLLERIGPGGPGALALINAEITRQAVFIAYLDDFKLMMLLTFAVLPLLLLMRKAKRAGAPAMAAD